VISCGQNDMKIPWKFHGNSMEFLCEKTMGYFCKGGHGIRWILALKYDSW